MIRISNLVPLNGTLKSTKGFYLHQPEWLNPVIWEDGKWVWSLRMFPRGEAGRKPWEVPNQLFLPSKLYIDDLPWPLNRRLHPNILTSPDANADALIRRQGTWSFPGMAWRLALPVSPVMSAEVSWPAVRGLVQPSCWYENQGRPSLWCSHLSGKQNREIPCNFVSLVEGGGWRRKRGERLICWMSPSAERSTWALVSAS